jgi:phosphoglycolate phosphatase
VLLVFDLDGTLVDSIHDLAETASDISERFGGTRLSDEDVALMIGDGAPVLVERVLARAGKPANQPGALDEFLSIYDARMFDTTRPYPGMTDTLRVLADAHALALLTNKPEDASRRILAHTGLAPFFTHMGFGDSPTGRKPAPDGLQWLMDRNGASAERTLLIGDSDVDLRTARAGGVRLCLARYGFGFIRVDPKTIRDDDLLIDQPSDLLSALNGPE